MSEPAKNNHKDKRPTSEMSGFYRLEPAEHFLYDPTDVEDAVKHVLGLGLAEIVSYDGSPFVQRDIAEEHAKAYFPHLFTSEVALELATENNVVLMFVEPISDTVIPLSLQSYNRPDGTTDWVSLRKNTTYAVTSAPLQLTNS